MDQQAVSQLGDYTVDRELGAHSYLARDAGGRHVVLKAIGEDCLLRGQLHPMIKDRLARVRELAHVGVANLLSAELLDGGAYLVWEYVEGITLRDYLQEYPQRSGSLRALGRELALHVETLHAMGIVHGSLHERNVIVTPAGNLRLTHVSPLLHQDGQVDLDALGVVLGRMQLGWAMADGGGGRALRDIIARLSRAGERNEAGGARPRSDEERGIRRLAVLGALAVAALGAAMAWGIWRWVRAEAQQESSMASCIQRVA